MVLDVDASGAGGLRRRKSSCLPRTDDTEARVLDLGAQDFLTKPVQAQSLQARVKAVLRRAKMP